MQTSSSPLFSFKRFFFSVPLVLLGVLTLAFGLQLGGLGYGYDEWHFVYYALRGIEGIKEIFNYDGHPQSVWSYVLSFNLLGYRPLGWHIYSLLWRWLAACALWWCFHLTWPRKPVQTFSAAVLFAVYPFFSLQFFPIAYSEIWLSYVFLCLSVAFSLLAVRRPERFVSFTALAVFFKLAHVFSSEYTWFIEVMRPALLWCALPSELSMRERFRRTVFFWLPYFLLFAGAALWRGFFYVPTRATFQVQAEFLDNPLIFLQFWALNILSDAVLSLITSWYEILSPSYFALTERWNGILLGLSFLSALFLFFYISRLPQSPQTPEADRRWAAQAFLTGALVIACGIAPYYLAGYNIYLAKSPINSRFALGFLPGAALTIAALLETVISSRRTRIVLLALMVGFSIGWHNRYTRHVRRVWEEQSDLFRQLAWRAPALKPGTVVRVFSPSRQVPPSPARVLMFGDFGNAVALNVFYQPAPQGASLDYWYIFQGDSVPIEPLPAPIEYTHATLAFRAEAPNELWIYFEPQSGQCLQALYPLQAQYRLYPEAVRAAAQFASLDAIDPAGQSNVSLMNEILEIEQPEDWCYYFQKADLARQLGDWSAITDLWNQAQLRGLTPQHGMEYLPFIEGFARQGKWGLAVALSKRANQISRSMNKALCPLWESLIEQEPNVPQAYKNCD